MQMLDKDTRPVVDALFQRVRNHLLSQYVRCVAADESCRWRQERNGIVLHCAIGCLIPGDLYVESLESVKTVEALFIRLPDLGDRLGVQPATKKTVLGFLAQLQSIHDDTGPSHWEDKLQRLALQYGLR